jgi:hypothetical protein
MKKLVQTNEGELAGKRAATAGPDRQILVWNVKNAQKENARDR